MPTANLVDLSHHNGHVDFGELKNAGVVGVILKASQGASYVDPNFADNYARATLVFGKEMVHCYHFLTDEDPQAQAGHAMSTVGGAFLWLDYEQNPDGPTCSLDTASAVCHIVGATFGFFPGMYGSDGDLLGAALDAGHFDVCPLWIAKYSAEPPSHRFDIWQYDDQGSIAGLSGVDLDSFAPNRDAEWFSSL